MASESSRNPPITQRTGETSNKNLLIAQRTGQRGSLTKLLNKTPDLIKNVDVPRKQLLLLQDHHQQIENKLLGLKQIYLQLLEITQDDEIASLVQDHEDHEARTRDTCLDLRLEVASLMDSLHNPSAVTQAISPPASIGAYAPNPSLTNAQAPFSPLPHQMSSKLQKLSLVTFDGNLMQWKRFWDSFSSEIDAHPSLTPISKFNYLYSLLGPEPARVIEGLTISNDSYPQAVSLLKERYGQEDKIIATFLRAFHTIPSPSHNVSSFRLFYDTIQSYIRSLETLGKNTDSYGDLLVCNLLDKLPNDTRRALRRENNITIWTLDNFRQALFRELQMREINDEPEVTVPVKKQSNESEKQGTSKEQALSPDENSTASALLISQDQKQKTPKCAFCTETHYPTNCPRYKTPEERSAVVREKKLCFNCLSSSGQHRVINCPSKGKCRKCGRRHHTSIHTETPDITKSPSPQTDTVGPVELSVTSSDPLVASVGSQSPKLALLQTAKAEALANGRTAQVNILFDPGAQHSLITESTANSLNCMIIPQRINLNTAGANRSVSLGIVELFIKTISGELIFLKAHVLPRICAPVTTHTQESLTPLSYLTNLQLAHPHAHGKFEVDVLIGSEYYWSFVEDEIIRGPGPCALKSKLGYLLSGPLPFLEDPNNATNLLILASPPSPDPLERFWDLEAIGISGKSHEDVPYVEEYRKTSIHFREGRYSVKLPWKREHPTLPNNFEPAFQRTKSLVRRLSRTSNTKLLETYDSIINEQLSKGIIEETYLSADQMVQSHFLPHRPVVKSSSSTPVRIVYDCSCRASPEQPSLNDCLEAGPPLQKDLCGILLRFRLSKFAVMADIEKAFHQIELDESDRNFLSFMWPKELHNPNSPMRTFRFRVVIFGATSSPFILNAVLDHHLHSRPCQETQELVNSLYVDNVLASFPSCEETLSFYKISRSVLNEASMNLRNWITNCPTLLERLPLTEKSASTTEQKALGLLWNPQLDYFKIASSFNQNPTCTKRNILQTFASLYDPLGFLAPVTIRGKILLQTLWKEKLDWDTPLPSNLEAVWNRLTSDLKLVREFTIPRNLGETRNSTVSIHVFADASPSAYGAVAYLVNDNSSLLMMSRNRVAPLKCISLARLELLALLIASRLLTYIIGELNFPPKANVRTFLWTDSKIALYWVLNNHSKDTFIFNRVNTINAVRSQHAVSLRYCISQENPADLLTRGVAASNLLKNKMWKFGPDWLISPHEWPAEETSGVTCIIASTSPLPMERSVLLATLSRCSSWEKAIRVVAYVFRFLTNLQNSLNRIMKISNALSLPELLSSERSVIREIQYASYRKEIDQLKDVNRKGVTPLISQLDLFLDNELIIRCKGRLSNAPLTYETICPILIPKGSLAAKLLMMKAHTTTLHSGVNATVSHLRKSYWIPAARQLARGVISSCVTCKKVMGNPYPYPPPPPLPKNRLQPFDAFHVTGVDFAGPLFVKLPNKESGKRYICLFTCSVSRAVHLELLPSLDSSSFLLGFRRFVSRRTLPSLMLSDNARTFESVAKDLTSLADDPELCKYLIDSRVEWRFIPKRAPWFGGMWERLIGLTKNTLKKVLGHRKLFPEELETIITEVESILNDRPLTYVSSSLNDESAITPSLLLYGKRTKLFPALPLSDHHDVTFSDDPESFSRLIRYRRETLTHVWNRFRNEYLTSLREFHQHCQKPFQNVINVGDIVHVHSEEKRIKWKMAKVLELKRSPDGYIRTANIQMENGVANRPICKLYPLEVNNGTYDPPSSREQLMPQLSVSSTRRLPRLAAIKARDKIRLCLDERGETLAGAAGCRGEKD